MSDKKYFNVITKGLGYLNDARVVAVDGGSSYLAVRVSLLEGHEDNVRYTYVDCIVKGEKVTKLIQQYQSQIEDKDQKVIASVDLGSLKAKPFTYKRGAKQGQLGAALKAALIGINYLKIGGQVVYQNADKAESQTVESEQEKADQRPRLEIVKLSKDDPDFETKKARLKSQGYTWDQEKIAWTPAKKVQAA